ncbi:MAG: hypothetical protein WC341_01845 [Bacteroidales bacterium]|jgi:hypothetical protein
MTGFIAKSTLIGVMSLWMIASATASIPEGDDIVFENAGFNHKCFNCHGQKTYHYFNQSTEKEVKDRMNPYFVIDSVAYYQSNHRSFMCTDCHSSEYEEFPHNGELRMEPQFACMDCHGGDPTFAQYQFERIEQEFQQSVHSTKHSDDFTCWMCHNPHTYKINARNNLNINEVIIYDNNICLSCHADINKYQLISDQTNPNVLETHDWLPNQALHFSKVRCIECHTEIDKEMLIAHKVQVKEKAVKRCVECHSQNSLLMATLYKFQTVEKRNKLGFFNAAILSDHYIIGANRNYYLNVASLIIFGLTLLGITIHAIIRIMSK